MARSLGVFAERHAVECHKKSLETLLTVYDAVLGNLVDLLVSADGDLLLRRVRRRLPEHDVADGIAADHGVEEVTNLVVLHMNGR